MLAVPLLARHHVEAEQCGNVGGPPSKGGLCRVDGPKAPADQPEWLAALQKESGFGTQELQAVMKSFKSHSSYDEKNPVVNKEHFAEVMGDVFEHMNRALADKLFDSMDDGEPLSPRQPLPYRLTSHSTCALRRE